MFEYSERPLTPSFVGDAIAPAANNRYSVPYESSYPSQKGQIWAKTGSDLLFFCILAEKGLRFALFLHFSRKRHSF